MGRIELDKPYKKVVYRIGLGGMITAGIGTFPIGLIALIPALTYLNTHWDDDVYKKKTNKITGVMEHIFYFFGYFALLLIAIVFMAWIMP